MSAALDRKLSHLNAAKRDREQDILDAYYLKQITRDAAAKLLTELYRDHYDAYSSLRLADECNRTGDDNETR